ncbi:hypothetical protein BD310DRAFT_964861 [Dichomitus squalens]|uniref:Uncharacterized protein n=1 Tax=Dichomitus squalens TaxID=114155 RepID=A0A4Q9Q8R0_9APHY|nr:hypothetical protein BD310DRAFT_964861 [Dichomitus squalens]
MAVNNIVASLERDAPLSSDIIQINYPQATVDEFLRHSQTVVDSMLSASNRSLSPPLGLAAAAINIAVMPQTVDNEVVRARNRELDAARAHLDSQRDVLARERAECARLISKVAELRTRGKQLAAEARTLRAAQRLLAELSTRISTRSATIATIRSMRNVVAGIRGVVDGLRRVEMFVGPLALLNDAAFGVLDRRVAAIRRSRLTV